jgi:hypothetical protein
MKYLNTFESKKNTKSKFEDFTRKYDEYQHVDSNTITNMEKIIREHINEINIISKIKKLKLIDFETSDFIYREIFDNIITASTYNDKNIYYKIDDFVRYNNIKNSTPAIRNSVFDIINKIFDESNLENEFNKKLIKLFDKNHEEYKYVDLDLINKTVRDACDYILDSKKYNI